MKHSLKSSFRILSLVAVAFVVHTPQARASEGEGHGQIRISVSVMPQSRAGFESKLNSLASENDLPQLCQGAAKLAQVELRFLGEQGEQAVPTKQCESFALDAFSQVRDGRRASLQTIIIKPL